MPALVLEGPDMVIQPSTKAFMARSVRRVLPFPLGPQKMSSSVCSPNCSKLHTQNTRQGQRAWQRETRGEWHAPVEEELLHEAPVAAVDEAVLQAEGNVLV